MRYQVKAVLAGRGTVFLELDADSAEEARLQVVAQGGMVLNVKRRFSGWMPTPKLRFPLAHFSQELLSLLVAGLSLVESIETLADKEQDARVRKIIEELLGAALRRRYILTRTGVFSTSISPALCCNRKGERAHRRSA